MTHRTAAVGPASSRGQATVEFSLVAIVLLLLFFAIIDFGRLVATHAAVVTASREAARYGAAVGIAGNGDAQYVDCPGIQSAARRVVGGFVTLANGDIVITWDRDADNDGVFNAAAVDCGDESDVDAFDRVVVRVTTIYRPITPLLQDLVPPLTITSIDRRTVVKAP